MSAVRQLLPGFGASKSKVSSLQRAIFDPYSVSGTSHFSQSVKYNGKHLVTSLEGKGVPLKQAESIIAVTTKLLNVAMENMSKSMISNGEIQKIEMMQEFIKIEAELRRSQLHQFSQFQNQTEKVRNDVEKMVIELRYEIGKSAAGCSLDLHDEIGKLWEKMSNQMTNTGNLIYKLDSVSNYGIVWELNSLQAEVVAAEEDIFMKCCIGIMSICVAVVAGLRIYKSIVSQ